MLDNLRMIDDMHRLDSQYLRFVRYLVRIPPTFPCQPRHPPGMISYLLCLPVDKRANLASTRLTTSSHCVCLVMTGGGPQRHVDVRYNAEEAQAHRIAQRKSAFSPATRWCHVAQNYDSPSFINETSISVGHSNVDSVLIYDGTKSFINLNIYFLSTKKLLIIPTEKDLLNEK
eukprot:scaffold49541_cov39-Prasinocladus_malaysianus.AAC.2